MIMDISKPKSKYKKSTFKDPYIYVVDGALTKKFCKKVIKKFEKDDTKKLGCFMGEESNEVAYDTDVKTSIDLFISGESDWEKEDKVFHSSLNKNYYEYIERLYKLGLCNSDLSDLIDVGYQIQRTEPGGYYTFHHDFDPVTVRYLTFIWYLNDVTNDGYTEFIDGTRVQPKAGRFLMFPATWTYVHRGYPPKNEVKYICTGWMSLHDRNGKPQEKI
tara:strand:- start:65 stop:715 length:651 start_codon:yes stop_codon:yes gene_type:complete